MKELGYVLQNFQWYNIQCSGFVLLVSWFGLHRFRV